MGAAASQLLERPEINRLAGMIKDLYRNKLNFSNSSLARWMQVRIYSYIDQGDNNYRTKYKSITVGLKQSVVPLWESPKSYSLCNDLITRYLLSYVSIFFS